MTLPLAGDIVVAILLVVTIVYAAMLNRRLASLRRDKMELQALIPTLGMASHGAEAAVAALKSANEDFGRQLATKVERAQGLRDDLAYMIERGNTLADRLEGGIRAGRDLPATVTPARKPEPRPVKVEARAVSVAGARTSNVAEAHTDSDADERQTDSSLPSRTERDLLRALAGRR
jgi:Domain of unknown function (DUF6468)